MSENTLSHNDTYFTIEQEQRIEQKISASTFIASVFPVQTKEQAIEFIDKVGRKFFDATHNCYAYRIGSLGLEYRFADDGEPNGTAGKPILFSLQKFGVSDVLLIVTRYYGGTKLGKGGLARAYASTADEVLKLCTKKAVYITQTIRVFTVYQDVSIVLSLVEKYATHSSSEYGDAVQFSVKVPLSKVSDFCSEITQQTNGRAGAVVEK